MRLIEPARPPISSAEKTGKQPENAAYAGLRGEDADVGAKLVDVTEDGPAHIAAGREKIGRDWVHLAGVVKHDRVELYVNGRLTATAKTYRYLEEGAK